MTLSVDISTQDIESMLADCGPIKRVDLIKTIDKATGEKLSRGFGFVTFALEADAARAVESVNGKRWGKRCFLMCMVGTCSTEGILLHDALNPVASRLRSRTGFCPVPC